MKGVIRANLGFFLFYTLFAITISTIPWFSAIGRLRLPIALFNGAILLLMGVSAVITRESQEEKFNGYDILAQMPVNLKEIVRAKLLINLGSITAIAIFDIVFFSFFESGPGVLSETINIIIVAYALTIALTGGTYMIAFRYRTRYLMFVIVGMMLFINILGLAFFKLRPRGVLEAAPSFIGWNPAFVFILTVPASMALYAFFARRGAGALRRSLFT